MDNQLPSKVPPVVAANIKLTADALGVSAECAVYLMSIVSLMRLGTYKTRLDYAQAIKDVEKKFKVDVIGLMPGYLQDGDPDFISEMKGLITSTRYGWHGDCPARDEPAYGGSLTLGGYGVRALPR